MQHAPPPASSRPTSELGEDGDRLGRRSRPVRGVTSARFGGLGELGGLAGLGAHDVGTPVAAATHPTVAVGLLPHRVTALGASPPALGATPALVSTGGQRAAPRPTHRPLRIRCQRVWGAHHGALAAVVAVERDDLVHTSLGHLDGAAWTGLTAHVATVAVRPDSEAHCSTSGMCRRVPGPSQIYWATHFASAATNDSRRSIAHE